MTDLKPTCKATPCPNETLIARGLCSKHYTRWQRTGDVGEDSPRPCLGCEESFTPTRSDQRFCTRSCGQRAASRRSRGLQAVISAKRSCGWCDTTFRSTDGRQLYCQPLCARIADLLHEIGRKYGLTLKQYRHMYIGQGKVCALCKRPESYEGREMLCVDHCHTTGRVRGLLCSNCNRGLGLLRDDPALLRAAAAYLET